MSDVLVNEIRRGFYLDSVALMRLSREVAGAEGVIEAALMMGSPSNLAIMRDAGLIEAGCDARPNDLVLGLRARDAAAAEAARALALEGLDRPRASAAAEDWRPRSIAAATEALPAANLALVSVPGDFAATEARRALGRGLNVLMFSDNVALEDERSLKLEARERGLLMMGPDCGTAILNGTPLAFANRVARGAVGIVGASGTGIQEVSCLVSEAGRGISHAIGVGGRDLKHEIGGITTMMALELLDADPATDRIVLISKPPHPEVAAAVLDRIAQSAKPHVVCFIGADPMDLPPGATQAFTLHEAAEMALDGARIGAGFSPDAAPRDMQGERRAGRIEGLFCGGTLAAEAQIVLRRAGRNPVSNAPVPGVAHVGDGAAGDRVLDLGADEYTRGRPHPMIDPSVRDEMLARALGDDAVGAILLDLVIGFGAHDDPAGQTAEVLAAHAGPRPPVVASVTGTAADPQDKARQAATLRAAGIVVAPSNAQASALAVTLAQTARAEAAS
ncbi:acyl-CoA synthetase FdrA [Palleronia sediminis]|uniref:Acyl-CoA synthetase FdrA n=1 Tax=Palleronia sediminis TaxID=2547833 RepID=A0A4R6ADH9_9RHOB|nr:acyl-CoA synthetase FdrA [Palleronia sediminis]TDL81257.1 acyl-CoA synthetase FdrA [Palleronia sediminis]